MGFYHISNVSKPKRGAWHVYHPGYLALYGIVSVFLILFIILMWSVGGAVLPGLVGIFFFVMAGRQLHLKGEQRDV
jgi:hypothetical protein